MFWFKIESKSKGKVKKKNKPGKRLVKNKSKKTVNKKSKNIKPTKTVIRKEYIRRQDMSLQPLKELLLRGYNMVTFEAGSSSCPICQKINGKTWTLQQFLTGLNYSAPIYENSHVQCLDSVRVWDSTGELPDVYVDANGDIY